MADNADMVSDPGAPKAGAGREHPRAKTGCQAEETVWIAGGAPLHGRLRAGA